MAEKKITREERMAKMNTELSDAEMAMATGGLEGDQPEPKFKVGDRFKETDSYIFEGVVKGIHGYYGDMVGWVYDCSMRDAEGWFDSIEYEFNMDPY